MNVLFTHTHSSSLTCQGISPGVASLPPTMRYSLFVVFLTVGGVGKSGEVLLSSVG